ncbi:MAG: hypothetical protein AAF433_16420 [Bacteroidota bacterium]
MVKFLYCSLLFFPFCLPAQVLPIGQGEEVVVPGQSWERGQYWEEVRELDGRFSVSIPATWDEQIDTIETEVGFLAYHTFFLQSPSDQADNAIYMLSYVDYPEGALHHDSTELVVEFFDVSQEEAIAIVDGELLFTTDKEKDGFPGRFWRIDYLDGAASIRTQAYVVGRRFYQIQTIAQQGRGLNDSTERFFESLEFF